MRKQRQELRVNPIDTRKNTAVGISIPFNGVPVFNQTYTTKDQVKSNLINYFLTNRGERIFNPNFGGDLRSYIFDQQPEFEQLQDYINGQLEVYFPQILVNSLKVDINQDDLSVTIALSYSVNNTSDNLQIQFSA